MHQSDAGTRIKVCGFTRPEDALGAFEAGVRAFGVVLAPSRRQVTLELAEEILAPLPDGVMRIGVFVDAPAGEVAEAAARLGLTLVQLHGSESPEYCAALGLPVMKALRVGPDFDPALAERYRGAVTALLLDTLVAGEQGGTGVPFDWSAVASRMPRIAPVIVAGGLRPDNVAEAIRVLRPFGVDVSSGVESSPGVKDMELIRSFVAAVEAADTEGTDV